MGPPIGGARSSTRREMPSFAVSISVLGLIQGALVALPGPVAAPAAGAWATWRSRWWALLPAGVDRRRHPRRQLLRGLGDVPSPTWPWPGCRRWRRSPSAGCCRRVSPGLGVWPPYPSSSSPGRRSTNLAARRRRPRSRRSAASRSVGSWSPSSPAPGCAGALRDGRGRHLARRHQPAAGPQLGAHRRCARRRPPRLQAVHLGSAAMGFGDLVAALVGCLLVPPDRRRQLAVRAPGGRSGPSLRPALLRGRHPAGDVGGGGRPGVDAAFFRWR